MPRPRTLNSKAPTARVRTSDTVGDTMRIPGLILAAALAGAALVTVPTASTAGSSLCAGARVCIYDDANWVALLGSRAAGGGNANVSTANNDRMTSWENKTKTNARWHIDGTCRNMAKSSELYYVTSTYNDKLTSWATNGAC